MKRTPALQAAAAALGVLAGFALSPADRSPLEGAVAPFSVEVAWRSPGGEGIAMAPRTLDRYLRHAPRDAVRFRIRKSPAALRADEVDTSEVKARLIVLRHDKRTCERERGES